MNFSYMQAQSLIFITDVIVFQNIIMYVYFNFWYVQVQHP